MKPERMTNTLLLLASLLYLVVIRFNRSLINPLSMAVSRGEGLSVHTIGGAAVEIKEK